MKVIIAGGRDFQNREMMDKVLWDMFAGRITEHTFLVGKARGADTVGEAAVRYCGCDVEEYPADWNQYGKRAGFIRNEEMAKAGNVLVAFWDGISKGTWDMIERALSHGLEVHVYRYAPEEERF
jgi:SLOG family YspA-like protein